MVCDRCGEREATIHLAQVVAGAPVRGAHLCEPCAAAPAPPDLDDARRLVELEARGGPHPGAAWFRMAAAELARRAAAHGQALPADVQAFVDRHRP